LAPIIHNVHLRDSVWSVTGSTWPTRAETVQARGTAPAAELRADQAAGAGS
jgi:hypothetical protein